MNINNIEITCTESFGPKLTTVSDPLFSKRFYLFCLLFHFYWTRINIMIYCIFLMWPTQILFSAQLFLWFFFIFAYFLIHENSKDRSMSTSCIYHCAFQSLFSSYLDNFHILCPYIIAFSLLTMKRYLTPSSSSHYSQQWGIKEWTLLTSHKRSLQWRHTHSQITPRHR